jgi:lactoylglutathione lyase
MSDEATQGARLGYVILYVEDLDRAVEFYTATFGLAERFKQELYAELDTGETTLSLAQRDFVEEHFGVSLPQAGLGTSEVGFVVEKADVDRVYQRAMGQGVTPVLPPADQPWGQRVSYVRDPDGHLLEICSPVS